MNEPSSRDGPRRLALRVDAVDVQPTDLGSFLVRVAGSWEPGAERGDARGAGRSRWGSGRRSRGQPRWLEPGRRPERLDG